MRKRDLAILNDLQRFRCLTRDDIIDLHFSKLKNPITCCNTVLKRLRRDGHIDVSTNFQPFVYFSFPSSIKKDSMKIPHFLKIVAFYKSLRNFEDPRIFIVEPKYGKGNMEPDAFMIWRKAPFFVEIQHSVYSDKIMNEKVKRYENYYFSNQWQHEPWQPLNKKVFPSVILITNTRYNIKSPNIRFCQVQNIQQLIRMSEPKNLDAESIKINNSTLKIKLN